MKQRVVYGDSSECRPLILQNSDKESVVLYSSGPLIQSVSLNTGELLGTFRGHASAVSCIAKTTWNPILDRKFDRSFDSSFVISGSIDGTIITWDWLTMEQLLIVAVSAPLYDIIVPSPESAESSVVESAEVFAVTEVFLVLGNKNNKDEEVRPTSPLATESTDERGMSSSSRKRRKASDKEDERFRVVLFDLRVGKTRRRVCSIPLAWQSCAVLRPSGDSNNSEGSNRFSEEEQWLVVADKRKLVIWSVDEKIALARFLCDGKREAGNITCVDVNNERGIIATGHDNGEIMIWFNVVAAVAAVIRGGNANKTTPSLSPTIACHHWHAHAVSCVSFSRDGVFLYSGGEEGVLVVWQTDSGNKTGYLPRLGGSVLHVCQATNGPQLCLATDDNSIRVFNMASLKQEWLLRRLFVPSQQQQRNRQHVMDSETALISGNGGTVSVYETVHGTRVFRRRDVGPSSNYSYLQADARFRCQIALERRTGFLACNGYPGELQMVQLVDAGSAVTERGGDSAGSGAVFRTAYEVLQYTRVSRKEVSSRMYVPSLLLFEFAELPLSHVLPGNARAVPALSLLLTVDARKGEGLAVETSLKFWLWDGQKNKYRLSAEVDRPHGPHRVVSLAVFTGGGGDSSSCAGARCVTAAVDGSVKVWQASFSQRSTEAISVNIEGGTKSPDHSNGNSSDNMSSSGVKGKMSQELVWRCAHSFTYREGVCAHAVRYSRDGSLLALAQGNQVTLWDPVTLALHASVVADDKTLSSSLLLEPVSYIDGSSNSSNNRGKSRGGNAAAVVVSFVQFVEPRAAAELGGGCGEAFLLLGSQRALWLYDLLSLSLVWDFQVSSISAIAVAKNETEACVMPNKTSRAWIAACVRGPSSKENTLDKVGCGSQRDRETEKDVGFQIVLFGTESADPLGVHPLWTRDDHSMSMHTRHASSLLFLSQQQRQRESQGGGDDDLFRPSFSGYGLVMLTNDGELHTLRFDGFGEREQGPSQEKDAAAFEAGGDGIGLNVAKITRKAAPTLAVSREVIVAPDASLAKTTGDYRSEQLRESIIRPLVSTSSSLQGGSGSSNISELYERFITCSLPPANSASSSLLEGLQPWPHSTIASAAKLLKISQPVIRESARAAETRARQLRDDSIPTEEKQVIFDAAMQQLFSGAVVAPSQATTVPETSVKVSRLTKGAESRAKQDVKHPGKKLQMSTVSVPAVPRSTRKRKPVDAEDQSGGGTATITGSAAVASLPNSVAAGEITEGSGRGCKSSAKVTAAIAVVAATEECPVVAAKMIEPVTVSVSGSSRKRVKQGVSLPHVKSPTGFVAADVVTSPPVSTAASAATRRNSSRLKGKDVVIEATTTATTTAARSTRSSRGK